MRSSEKYDFLLVAITFKKVQGTDVTIHEPHPFECSHMRITRGATKPTLVDLYK